MKGIKSTFNTSAAQAFSSLTLIIIQGTSILFCQQSGGNCNCIDLNIASISRFQIINHHILKVIDYYIITSQFAYLIASA